MTPIENGLDISKLREYDIPHLQNIIEYLKQYDLDIKSVGSVLNGDKIYTDIDLAITGSEEKINMIIKDIIESNMRESIFKKKFNGTKYEIEYNAEYMCGTARGEIKVDIEETKIHLILRSLESKDPVFSSRNT